MAMMNVPNHAHPRRGSFHGAPPEHQPSHSFSRTRRRSSIAAGPSFVLDSGHRHHHDASIVVERSTSYDQFAEATAGIHKGNSYNISESEATLHQVLSSLRSEDRGEFPIDRLRDHFTRHGSVMGSRHGSVMGSRHSTVASVIGSVVDMSRARDNWDQSSEPSALDPRNSSSIRSPQGHRDAHVHGDRERERGLLVESLIHFACHTPNAVLEDLLATQELDLIKEQDNASQTWTSIVEKKKKDPDVESLSSLSTEEPAGDKSSMPYSDKRSQAISSFQNVSSESLLPSSRERKSALLFLDISGFTKLSTLLDVESLSKVINSYFDLIVQEVLHYGGDVLKFAGDAFFAEWRVHEDENNLLRDRNTSESRSTPLALHGTSSPSELETDLQVASIVRQAANCAASIVKKYSDHRVPLPGDSAFNKENVNDSMLNVHCGIGVGTLIGLHVRDYQNEDEEGHDDSAAESRREYLFLGDAIDQVACAEQKASHGEVYMSPEALRILSTCCKVPSDLIAQNEPLLIASREETFIDLEPKDSMIDTLLIFDQANLHVPMRNNMRKVCNRLRLVALRHLHQQLSLYIHPVARRDESSLTETTAVFPKPRTAESKHLAEAELRSVYTLFCKALIAPRTTGDLTLDGPLFKTLGDIMHVISRTLDRYSGHLRQFIVDDKGVVLIATFGLRGSTFPNLVGINGLPATIAIHRALREELGIDNRIGATWGQVYCGVVGGMGRHEYCVLGAPVNLAARLMESPMNKGILVDEAVRVQAGSQFEFSSLQPVNAKGYDEPVAIYQPLGANLSSRKRVMHHAKFTGRQEEVTAIVGFAREIINDPATSQNSVVTIMGESGIGKSALGLSVISTTKGECLKSRQRVVSLRSTSTESEQRIPLCAFRKVVLKAIRELCLHEGSLSSGDNRTNTRPVLFPDGTKSVGNNLPSAEAIFSRGDTSQGNQESLISWQERAVRPKIQSILEKRRSFRTENRRGSTKRSSNVSALPKPTAFPASSNRGKSQPLADGDRRGSFESTNETHFTMVPYLEKLCWACEQLGYPHEYADLVGSQFLGLEKCHPLTHIAGHVPTVSELVEFVAQVFMKVTDFADLIILFLDDFQWVDSFTWKVVRLLCQTGKKMLILFAMRSHDKQALRRMSTAVNFKLEINLGPLDIPEIQDLICSTLTCDRCVVDETLCSDVLRRTGGAPVYVIELLEALNRNQCLYRIESGKLRLIQSTQILDRDKGNSALVESLLNRFDSLDVRVRKMLHTCAVLGNSFALSDLTRVHSSIDEREIEQALDNAITEIILIEMREEDEDSKSAYSAVSGGSESRFGALEISKTASGMPGLGDRFFEFSHDMWRSTVLRTMLKERKMELHRQIAEAMEKEQTHILQRGDIPRLLTLFDHWKCCRDFEKVAPLALTVGVRLQEWDLLVQSLELYQVALDLCYDNVEPIEDWSSQLEDDVVPVSATPEVLDLILRLKVRLALCQKSTGELHLSSSTLQEARITHKSSSGSVRSMMIPILSELCTLKLEMYRDDDERLHDLEVLIQEFVEAAKEERNAVHLSRAISMQAMFYAEQGNYERATNSQQLLQSIYEMPSHSDRMIEVYEKDHAMECFSQSIFWYFLIGDEKKATEQAEFVVEHHLPYYDPHDIDGIMSLILPAILVLKFVGKAAIADYLMKRFVVNGYHDLVPLPTYWREIFNPICHLLEVVKMEDIDDFDYDLLREIESWVLDEVNTFYSPEHLRLGHALMGEICWRLGSLKQEDDIMRKTLLQRTRWFLTPIARDTQTEPFLVHSALAFLQSM